MITHHVLTVQGSKVRQVIAQNNRYPSKNLHTMASSQSFDQLADRLRRLSLNEGTNQETIDEIKNMKLEDLKGCVIDFGKAHVGKKYQEMISETRYLTWFADTYRASQKPSHVKFLRFIELHVDQIEQQMNLPRPKTMAKAKATAKARAQMPEQPHDPWHPASFEEEDVETLDAEPWDAITEPVFSMEPAVQYRMDQLENMMNQILMHLNQGHPASNSPAAP